MLAAPTPVLTEHFGDVCPGAAMRVSVDDVDALAESLCAKQYKYARPGKPEPQPWGSRELRIHDPFGNRLTFCTTTSAPE